jgi:hypothetical protein
MTIGNKKNQVVSLEADCFVSKLELVQHISLRCAPREFYFSLLKGEHLLNSQSWRTLCSSNKLKKFWDIMPTHNLYTNPHSKLEVCNTCSGSNHLIATQLDQYHVPHGVVLCGCFSLARTPLSFRRMLMPCSTTTDLFRTDVSVVLVLMQHPVCPM